MLSYSLFEHHQRCPLQGFVWRPPSTSAIEATFTDFVQQVHTHLNSKQQRFITMLKNHLVRYGNIQIEQLYEAPFTQIHDGGLDGVFSEAQADVIAKFIQQFGVKLGSRNQTKQQPRD